QLSPGDLLFFRIGRKDVSHVAIYAGDDRFIHAPSSGKRVSYGSMSDAYWKNRLVAAGRY
ncbi:MAG: C40 family peptidase, partial [Gammaproteobacteria bacterium]|nr:C40 family peptidase [Gammaproteobacteria bacterium]